MNQLEKILDIIKDTDKNFDVYYGVIPDLTKKNNYKLGITTGVFCGGQEFKILNETDCKIIGIDPFKMFTLGMPRMDSQSDWDLLYNIVFNRLNIASGEVNYKHIRKTSFEAFDELKNQKVDWIFLDSLHTYENLKFELENYGELVKTGGAILCHDYNHPYFPTLTNAIDEYVKVHNAKLIICPLHLVYMIKTW